MLLFALELQSVALGTFDALVAPAAAAKCYVTIVTANLHLVTIGNDIALCVDTGIDTCFATTCTCRLYLLDRVCNLKQTS